MTFGFQKYNNMPLECFTVWSGGFTHEEVDKILYLESLQNFGKGQLGSQNKDPDKEIRDSEVAWIQPDEHSHWVFERLGAITAAVNHQQFMYDIDGVEVLQYTKYKINQHYTWHWDVEFGWQNYQRKISAVMMLSDPGDYEGGEFEICVNGNFENTKVLKPNKGDIVFFASWMPHRVKPVISGERKSLVMWVMGKRQS
jgi:PKHD-type hydroxylase